MNDELTDDALTDRVRVYQRRRGHRYSFDDVITAWVAIRAAPDATECLDLGCGIGSVLLMVADRVPRARAVGIEAQEVSLALAQRNIERNRLSGRVQALAGDLRDASVRAQARRAWGVTDGARSAFDLITGTPPYKRPGTATASPDRQRAHARIELRGGVEDYLDAAAECLAPAGRVVVCMEHGAEARVLGGASRVGLEVCAQLSVVPIAGRKGRLFSVYTLAHARKADRPGRPGEAAVGAAPALPPMASLTLRDEQGRRTVQALELRRFFGLGGTG